MSTLTKAVVVLCCLELQEMGDMDAKPTNAVNMEVEGEKQNYLDSVCNDIVDHLWYSMDVDSLQGEGCQDYPYCCKQKLDETMVACEMGKECPNFEWFHLGCVNLSEGTIPEEWLFRFM